jgi:hypothetical protein
MSKRILLTVLVGLMTTAALATVALAGESLPAGDYTLTIPGAGDFEFTVTTEGEEATVVAVMAPENWDVDEHDAAKVEWKSTEDDDEVEAKDGKVEADVDWAEGDVVLSLTDGLKIIVSKDGDVYSLELEDSNGWEVAGGNGEWLILSGTDEGDEMAFKVEADEDGVEIKVVNPADDNFNDYEDEDESDDADDDGDEDEAKSNNGKGRP